MATFSGKDGLVQIAAAAVAKVKSWNINEETNLERNDGMGEDYEDYEPGKSRWSGTMEFLMDSVDVAQAAVTAGATGAATLFPGGNTSGLPQLTGNLIVQSHNMRVEETDRVRVTISFNGKGALTRGTVA